MLQNKSQGSEKGWFIDKLISEWLL